MEGTPNNRGGLGFMQDGQPTTQYSVYLI